VLRKVAVVTAIEARPTISQTASRSPYRPAGQKSKKSAEAAPSGGPAFRPAGGLEPAAGFGDQRSPLASENHFAAFARKSRRPHKRDLVLGALELNGSLHGSLAKLHAKGKRGHCVEHYLIIMIGFIAGIIARVLSPGPNELGGFILTTALGIAGAFVATFIGQTIGWYRLDQGAGSSARPSVLSRVVYLESIFAPRSRCG